MAVVTGTPVPEHDGLEPLVGRAAETERVRSMLDAIGSGGDALVLRGEPGVGKSRLLSAATTEARARGFTVLSATGVQAEARLPYAGLHQLLRPLRARARQLPDVLRDALDTAFGLLDGTAPERSRVAMAALDLLSCVANDAPVLIVAEDVQWLDRSTANALAFIARRVEDDPIVLLAALRDGFDAPLVDAGLAELRVSALEPDAAAQLLDASWPHLPSDLRARVLTESAGNPLALRELPLAGAQGYPSTAMPGLVTLTERLEEAFAARMSDLPNETRLVLLAAALSDADRVTDVLEASSAVAGTALGLESLEPAARAAIVDLDERRVRFRHPLMRSAVVQSASAPRRRRMHEALADVLHAEPERGVWHRAALISGAHEDVAVELEEAGRRAQRCGAVCTAVAALRRSAELSEPAERGRRLLGAAQLALELGQPDVVRALLREAEGLHSRPLDQARATWIEASLGLRPLGDAERMLSLIAVAEQAGEAGDRDLHIDLLWLVAQRSYYSGAPDGPRKALVEAARRLRRSHPDDPRVLTILVYTEPFGVTPEQVARLRAAAADSHDTGIWRYLSTAAALVGAFDTGLAPLGAAIERLRVEGRLGHLQRMLTLHGALAARVADWDVAIPAAEEARRLMTENREPIWEAAAEVVVSTIAGMRGDAEAAEEAALRAEQIALPLDAGVMVCMAQSGRILAALGDARYADAYDIAERLFDPADPSHHHVMSLWHIGDLAEAAAHVGRADEAKARVAQVEATVGPDPAIWIAMSLRHARALLAEDEREAALRFEEALRADAGLGRFSRARAQLAQGRWLRRRRQIADSRAPLRAARDTFDALGCAAFGDQARRELRASGEASRRRDPSARDQLTAQELQIAQLAAQGLSNREIGQRLYLSHRTIGTHLYRVFPKLGITARGELRAALDVA